MARISGTAGPSNSDLAKETALLVQQGKVSPNTHQPPEFANWKP